MPILLILLVLLLLAGGLFYLIHRGIRAFFAARCDEDPHLKYLTAEDLPGLAARPVTFTSGIRMLNGCFYAMEGQEARRGLIVFSHGYGGGHHSYTRLLYEFAKRDYLVFSYDNTGCASSPGEGIGSFYQGARDLRAALTYLSGISTLKDLPTALCGHSWGGYSVCMAPDFADAAQVRAIAAFSAMDDPSVNIASMTAKRTHLPEPLVRPFVRLSLYILDKKPGLRPASLALTEGKIPAILYHGTADTTVPPENSVVGAPRTGDDPKIRTRLLQGRGHNVYQTQEAEQYLVQTFTGIEKAKAEIKRRRAGSEEQLEALYASIDYRLITDIDPAVTEEVCAFFDRAFDR